MSQHSNSLAASEAGKPFAAVLAEGLRSWTGLLVVSALVVLFGFYTIPAVFGQHGTISAFRWMWLACNDETDYVHGRFIPLAIIALIIYRRREIGAAIVAPRGWGLVLVGFGLLFFLLAFRTVQPRLAIGALPMILLGSLVYLYGTGVAMRLAFPICLLYFAIPLPGLTQATTKLQILATQTAYHVSSILGADVLAAGNEIRSNNADWGFNVAEGCSGVRSLVALTLIAAIYAHVAEKTLWKKIVLFVSSVPLALIANGLRVTTIILIAEYINADFAGEAYHNYSGFIFFPIGLAGLILVDHLLDGRLPFMSRRGERRVKVTRTTGKPTS